MSSSVDVPKNRANIINIDDIITDAHTKILNQSACDDIDIETEVNNGASSDHAQTCRFPWRRRALLGKIQNKFPGEPTEIPIKFKVKNTLIVTDVSQPARQLHTLCNEWQRIKKPREEEVFYTKFPLKSKNVSVGNKFPMQFRAEKKINLECDWDHPENTNSIVQNLDEKFSQIPKIHRAEKFPLNSQIVESKKFPFKNSKIHNAIATSTFIHISNIFNNEKLHQVCTPIMRRTPATPRCTQLLQKFPLIKKQFFKFPNQHDNDDDDDDNLLNYHNVTPNRNDDVLIEFNNNHIERDNDVPVEVVDDDDVVAPALHHITAETSPTFNLNSKENFIEFIEIQQKQNNENRLDSQHGEPQRTDYDAFKRLSTNKAQDVNIDANVNVDAIKFAKNNEKNIVKFFEINKNIMTKSDKAPTNTATIYENLARTSKEHELVADFSTTTDNHTQQSQEQHSQQQQHTLVAATKQLGASTHSTYSDVCDQSPELHQLSFNIENVPVPVSESVSELAPLPDAYESAEFASLTIDAASRSECCASPNIDFISQLVASNAHEYIIDCGDDVQLCIDGDILTDIIELISCNLLLTDVLKAENNHHQINNNNQRENIVKSAAKIKEMTVTNTAVVDNESVDEIYTSSEEKLIDTIVSNVEQTDAVSDNFCTAAAMKYEIPHTTKAAPTLRMNDITPSALSIRSARSSNAPQSTEPTTTHAALLGGRGASGSFMRSPHADIGKTTTGRIRDVTAKNSNLETKPTTLARERLNIGTVEAPTTSRLNNDLTKLPAGTSTLSKDIRRSTSLDVPDNVLPIRTLLRRQRRMRSQDSVEEKPEDIIERMNKLKARISGALSEVKGVLKQYSTESEADVSGESGVAARDKAPLGTATGYTKQHIGKPQTTEGEQKTDAEVAPVQFRFIRKVRRKSIFSEEDEYQEQQNKSAEAAQQDKAKSDEYQKQQNKTTETEQQDKAKSDADLNHKAEKSASKPTEAESKLNEVKSVEKINGHLEQNDVSNLNIHQNATKDLGLENNNKTSIRIEDTTEKARLSVSPQRAKLSESDSEEMTKKTLTKLEFLNKVQEELKKKPKSKDTPKVEEPGKMSESSSKIEQTEVTSNDLVKDKNPEINEVEENKQTAEESHKPGEESTNKVKSTKTKKNVTKPKIDGRRASIAAVEESKIEPEPSLLPLKVITQRRPSDSEAVIKKKKVLSKKITSADELAINDNTASKTSVKPTKLISKIKHVSPKCVKAKAHPTTAPIEQQENELKVNEGNKKAIIDSTPQSQSQSPQQPIAKTNEDGVNDKNSNKDVVGVPLTATTATTTTTSNAITAAPKQSKIDHFDHVNGASSNGSTVSKVASGASPLPASEANTHAQRNSESNKLAELIGETVLVVPINQKEQTIISKDINTTSPENNSSQQATHSDEAITSDKKLINHETKDRHEQVATATQQQFVVAADIVAASSTLDKPAQVTTETFSANGSDATSSSSDVVAAIAEATKASVTNIATNSVATANEAQTTIQPTPVPELIAVPADTQPAASADEMPELQVQTGPVQPVKIDVAAGESKDALPFSDATPHDDGPEKKKKIIIKKLVRKNSIDKSASGKDKTDGSKLSRLLKDNKVSGMTANLNKLTPPKKQATKVIAKSSETVAPSETAETSETIEATEAPAEESEEAPIVELPPPVKKPRKVKKKVIIKRQQRRLSISDTFFTQPEEEPKQPEVETIEKAIAYVTDDEAEDEPALEEEPEPAKPLKTCLRRREYQVGDLVMYAERFKKTQVRWKKGRVLERITSISYLLEIEGKQVPAHISYIKKFTARKVNFGGKEYLEIDYEQVAEEERRARSYSIWNMV